jgi:hypothetical protein
MKPKERKKERKLTHTHPTKLMFAFLARHVTITSDKQPKINK